MLTWRNQNKLSYRYIHNINSVNDKISNSKEEKTSISMSIARMDGGITESHGETRLQHLHLQLRSGRLRNCKRVGVRGNLHLRNDGDFGFLEIPENRRVCRQDTQTLRKQRSTACSQARNAHHALGSSHTGCSVIFVRMKRICHRVLHMSHPCWLLPHLHFTTSTSSPSFTLLSSTTPEHAAQSEQHDLLQPHPVHHQPLHEIQVEKRRYQEEPLCSENLQSTCVQNSAHFHELF